MLGKNFLLGHESLVRLGMPTLALRSFCHCTPSSGDLMICNSSLFDVDMFKSCWKPVISAITHAFISFDDDYVIQRAIAGFRQCATLAGRFDLPDVFDFVVVSLSQATSLLSDSLPTQVPNYPVVEVDGQPITVSSLSVKFGTNFKGQLAAVVLFNIVNGNGNALREGWTQVCRLCLRFGLSNVYDP
jgi:brefeldin A-resistance guanine nucleotide exchange factor 1